MVEWGLLWKKGEKIISNVIDKAERKNINNEKNISIRIN